MLVGGVQRTLALKSSNSPPGRACVLSTPQTVPLSKYETNSDMLTLENVSRQHRERVHILSVLQRISCVCAHRSKSRPPAASACAEMDTRSGSTACGDTQGQRSSQSDQARPDAASQQTSGAEAIPMSRCSSSELACRQSTPEMVPVLRAQADARGKVSGRSGRTMRAAVG